MLKTRANLGVLPWIVANIESLRSKYQKKVACGVLGYSEFVQILRFALISTEERCLVLYSS